MLDPQMAAQMEQGVAAMREFYPAAMWALYSGSIEQGFTEAQSLDIAKHWLTFTIMRPADPPKEDWQD